MRIVEIQATVVEHFGLTMYDMRSISRKWDVVRPRQIAMYLCRELTDRSYPEIARAFAKHHSTVMSGVWDVGRRLTFDPELIDTVEAIRKRLAGR